MQVKDTYNMPFYKSSSSTLKPYASELKLNRISYEMKIDTGCSSALINKKEFNHRTRSFLKGGYTEITDPFMWSRFT